MRYAAPVWHAGLAAKSYRLRLESAQRIVARRAGYTFRRVRYWSAILVAGIIPIARLPPAARNRPPHPSSSGPPGGAAHHPRAMAGALGRHHRCRKSGEQPLHAVGPPWHPIRGPVGQQETRLSGRCVRLRMRSHLRRNGRSPLFVQR
uniref:Uncharacterized protein n=1 Tax=Anopheles atroparvus TaxID=41427 RepID=A0A182J6Z6_ANOAO